VPLLVPIPQVPAVKTKPSPPVEVAEPVEMIKKPTVFQSGAVKQSLIRRVVVRSIAVAGAGWWCGEVGRECVYSDPRVVPEVLHSPGKENTVVKVDVHMVYEKWVPLQGKALAPNLRRWWTQAE